MSLGNIVGDWRVAMALVFMSCTQLGHCEQPTAPPGDPVVIGAIAPVDIDWKTNSGQGWITVSNPTDKTQSVTLCAGVCIGGPPATALPAQITFQDPTNTIALPALTVSIDPGKSKSIKLLVSGYRRPGEAQGVVTLNQKQRDFRIQLLDVPFKVGLQTAAGDKAEVALVRNGTGSIVLTNDDPVAYPVHWCVYLPDDGHISAGDVSLPAVSAIPVTIVPQASWFRNGFQGLFKDDLRSARLTLRLAGNEMLPATAGPGTVPASDSCQERDHGTQPTLATKTLPLQMRLAYWDNGKFAGYLILLLVLALGAALSVVLNGWIPNYTSRAALIRRLGGLARSIRGISSQADSRLRVLLRVYRMGLGEQLGALKAPNLDTADQLKQLGTDIDVLSRRVDAALRLDALATRVRAACGGSSELPPTILDAVFASLAQATEVLCKPTLQDSDYALASAALDSAAASLDRLSGDNPALATELAGRVVELAALYAPAGEIGQMATCTRVRAATAPTLFTFLNNSRYADPAQILRQDYLFLDVSTRKLLILRDFIRIAETIGQDPNDARGKSIIASCQQQLLEQLRLNDRDALKRARSIVRQLDERILPEDIENALQRPLFTLTWDPPLILPNQPVRLCIRPTNPALENRSAQEDFTCEWLFPVGRETGWEITHYFRSNAETGFEVQFRKPDGTLVTKPGTHAPLTFTAADYKLTLGAVPAAKHSDTAKAESLRLVLALGLATMGLIAGAHEQFMKLDIFFGLLTVLMLGFSADTIKNLFGKRS